MRHGRRQRLDQRRRGRVTGDRREDQERRVHPGQHRAERLRSREVTRPATPRAPGVGPPPAPARPVPASWVTTCPPTRPVAPVTKIVPAMPPTLGPRTRLQVKLALVDETSSRSNDSMSSTKPRTRVSGSRNGSWRSWAMSRRTLCAGSRKACVRHGGRMPTSCGQLLGELVVGERAQPAARRAGRAAPRGCCSLRWLIVSERITSSVTTPPALRSTCTSPSFSPNSVNTSMRESMQVSTPCAAQAARRGPRRCAAARWPPPAS